MPEFFELFRNAPNWLIGSWRLLECVARNAVLALVRGGAFTEIGNPGDPYFDIEPKEMSLWFSSGCPVLALSEPAFALCSRGETSCKAIANRSFLRAQC
jgi:hypothetical protein